MPPKIIFGTATLGLGFNTPSAVTSVLSLLTSLEISELDSAARYPPTKPNESERLLGQAKAAGKGFAVDTKIYTAAGDGSGELSKDAIESSFKGSLERLGVDKVNILYCHRSDPTTPIQEQAAAFNDLYKEGKFQKLGVSNFEIDLLTEFLRVCDEKGFVKPTVYQGDYNLITRGMEKSLLPLLKKHGISFYGFRPLAASFLSGKGSRFSDSHPYGKAMQNMYGSPELQKAKQLFEDALKPLGISDREASLRWLAYHSALGNEDAMILGASKLEQISQNVESIRKGPLPKDLVDAIEGVWQVVEGTRGGIL